MRGSVIRYDGKRGTVWRIKYLDASGKQCMETVGAEKTGMTERRANELLQDRLSEVRNRNFRKPDAITFEQASLDWFEAEQKPRAWKPGTVGNYRTCRDYMAECFRGMQFSAISRRRVIEWRDDALRDNAPATVSRYLTVLNMIFKWGVLNEYRSDNPCSGVSHPKIRQHKGVVLTPVQVQALLRAFDDPRARTWFLTLLLTGMRKSEAQSLLWRDVWLADPAGPRLRVEDSKTEKGERSIAIPSKLAEELFQHRARSAFRGEDERVFCHPELGSRYRMDSPTYGYNAAVRRAFKTAGLEWPEGFRPCHDLRVTCATNDVIAGMHPDKLQAKLGHTDHSVTLRYVNLAGVVFADEAAALERRLFGAVESSTDLGESENTLGVETAWNQAESAPAD
jgi:integrase